MILSKKVKLTWNPNNKKWYENKGYIWTKKGEEFEVNVEDLNSGSRAEIEVLCDYCQTKTNKLQYKEYLRRLKKHDKYCCSNCIPQKNKETYLKKYGVEHISQTDKFKQKVKDACLNKYGETSFAKTALFKEKVKQTCLNKYGVEHHLASKEIQDKKTKTVREKYNVDNIMQYGDIAKKVREKSAQTLHKNNTGACSKQQKYIHSLIEGELNYPVGNYLLDIAFPNEKIYIEYNGGGHDLDAKINKNKEDFDKKERSRNYYLYRRGWKLIRIKSIKDYIPSDKIIFDMIKYAKEYLLQGKHHITFDIDNNKIIISKEEMEYNFGELRRIKL